MWFRVNVDFSDHRDWTQLPLDRNNIRITGLRLVSLPILAYVNGEIQPARMERLMDFPDLLFDTLLDRCRADRPPQGVQSYGPQFQQGQGQGGNKQPYFQYSQCEWRVRR